MSMTGRARIAAAVNRQPLDRTPVMCQLALGHYFLQTSIPAIDIWHATEGFGAALVALQRRYGFDGILVNLPGRDPAWRDNIRRIEERGPGKVIHWKNGWHTVCPADDNPHNYREDGKEYHPSFTEVDPDLLFYIEPHDLGGLKYPSTWGFSPDSPGPEFFPPWHFDTLAYVRRCAGPGVSLHAEVFSPLSQFFELLGFTAGLKALLQDPGKSKACLAALARGAIALGTAQTARGADAILVSSAFAGAGFLSPQHYREFVLPYEKEIVRGIKATHPVPIYIHTCGRIGDRLELMAESGADGLDTLDPPPLGNVDLADAKRRIGELLFLKGNMDPVHVILRGTPLQVREEALRCLRSGTHGGGYILSSACSIPPHAPPENIEMIAATAALFPFN
jgi:uroporphyrinogen-III decarboxylase